MQPLLFISIAILFYCYIGYGILLMLINGLKGSKKDSHLKEKADLLPVTLIVTAYNEAEVLAKKTENCLSLSYPAELRNFLFVTDGSDDDSVSVLKQYPQIKVLHDAERKGKSAAINHAMKHVNTEIVIFSDANTMLNKDCIEKIVRHYSNPKIGGVAGEKKIAGSRSSVGKAEGLYWKYESSMKELDSNFYTVLGAAGELFSIRSELFEPLEEKIILDDFIISMNICLRGSRIHYEPNAYATESPSLSINAEAKRKTRIAAGAYQSLKYLKPAFNFFKYPALSFQFISRRILRWIICPLLLIALAVSNTVLYCQRDDLIIHTLFYFQAGFYFFALIGWLLAGYEKQAGIFTIPFYFLFMNFCLVKGFFKFCFGKQTVLWEKAKRRI